jgi:transmembrane sensor
MSTEKEDLDQIEDAAAFWMAESEEGLTPARQREFERWQQSDPRHAAAVRKFQWGRAVLKKMPHIQGELQPVINFPEMRQSRSEVTRRSPIRWGQILGGCAAAIVLGAVTWWAWPGKADAQVRYACEAGGYQRVSLKDGSVLELNENSAVLVKLLPAVRHITLDAGEAHFSVAKDAARPFVVEARGVAVRAIGTAFRVRIEPASVDVLVTEGKVAVTKAESTDGTMQSGTEEARYGGGHLADVAAGEQTRIVTSKGKGSLTAVAKPTVEKATPEMIRRALDWQEKKLFFAEVPLRDVVAQFNRRNRLQLVIDDPQLASRPVGGTFAADNVEGFVRLLENTGTVTTDRRGEFEIVLRPRQHPPR